MENSKLRGGGGGGDKMFKGGRMILGDLSDRPTIKAHHSSIIMVVQTV